MGLEQLVQVSIVEAGGRGAAQLVQQQAPGIRGRGFEQGQTPQKAGHLPGLEAVPVAQPVQRHHAQQIVAGVVEQLAKAAHAVGQVLRERAWSHRATWTASQRCARPASAGG